MTGTITSAGEGRQNTGTSFELSAPSIIDKIRETGWHANKRRTHKKEKEGETYILEKGEREEPRVGSGRKVDRSKKRKKARANRSSGKNGEKETRYKNERE